MSDLIANLFDTAAALHCQDKFVGVYLG